MFASELFNVIPDLIVTAKGIAGGLPLAAVTGRIEIMDAAHVGGLGGTYGGNPVACAASLAAIETIKAENLVARAGEIERIMLTRLHRMQSDDNRIGDVRGRGAMIAVELVHQDTSDPDPAFTAAVAAAAREQGVIVLTCGTYGNVLRFLPPLAISDELLNDGLDVLAEAFASL
jgi:4-aminobutyrate aminotransferase/(S)-3-amino-2-methylpropionate transaminase